MRELQRAQVSAFRLTRHHLDRRGSKDNLARIVGEIGGLQAQVMGAASLALWARVDGLAAADVDDALLTERTLIRTWAMRGTLHILPANDLPIFLTGLRAAWRSSEQWLARLGVNGKTADRATEAIDSALGTRALTQRELSGSIRRAVGPKAARALDRALAMTIEDGCARMMLEHAGRRGIVCLGPSRGRETTFVRVDHWLSGIRPAPAPEPAQEGLLRRYLRAFGPATATDFAYWSGIPAADATAIMKRLRSETTEVQVDGQRGVMLHEDIRRLRRAQLAHPVRLLPNFDVFLLGHKDKAPLDARHYRDVHRTGGWIAATILVDGRIVGTWTRETKGRQLIIRLHPFLKLSRPAMRGIEGEVAALARFLNLSSAEILQT